MERKLVPLSELVATRKAEISTEEAARTAEEERDEIQFQSLRTMVRSMILDAVSEEVGVWPADIAEMMAVQDWRNQWGKWNQNRIFIPTPQGDLAIPISVTVVFGVGLAEFRTTLFAAGPGEDGTMPFPFYRILPTDSPFYHYGAGEPRRFRTFADAWLDAKRRDAACQEMKEARRQAQEADKESEGQYEASIPDQVRGG